MTSRILFRIICSLLAATALSSGEDLKPLRSAHSHNDYAHSRPLLDALDQGFCSVEADIFLVDGALLVGHSRSGLSPDRTLQTLYLDPLRERVRRNSGRVYPGGPEFWLLIDLKTDWHQLYPALHTVLAGYSNVLSEFTRTEKVSRAITVVISGDRALEMFDRRPVNYAAYDGQLSDLDSNTNSALIPWISANWPSQFKWKGRGEFPAPEKQKLVDLANKAKERGQLLRFWGGPDQPAFWAELHAAKVGLINTDNLAGFRAWFWQQGAKD